MTVGDAASTMTRPLPLPDYLTESFWDGTKLGKLILQSCNQCGHIIHYPQPVCPVCLSTDLGTTEVSGRGTVYSFTEATQGFHPFFAEQVPYILGIIELPEQPKLRMLSQIVDCDVSDVRIGMDVEVTYVRVSDDITLPLFRPASH
jgi:uncharacterized OB-fold protein